VLCESQFYKPRISSSAERIGLESSSLLLEEVDDESVDSLVTGEYSADVGDFGGLVVLEMFW
jgi:hypothetical protein